MLCAANGGPDSVAANAGVSSENLKQILSGVKLRSGAPRGVGPKLQAALEKHYPGWSRLGESPRPSGDSPIQAALEALARELIAADSATRSAVGSLLKSFAESPQDGARISTQVEALLQIGKRRVA